MDQISPEQFRSQLEGIHAEVGKRVESIPEGSRGEAAHKEVIHQVVGEKLGKIDAGTPPAISQATDLSPEVNNQVNILVQDAVTKDLEDAIKKAREQNDPLVLDAFHDALVGELYNQLVSEGKLKSLSK